MSDVKGGTVKWFDKSKGFGFITADDHKEDVFVHYSVLPGKEGDKNLLEGDRVSYIEGRRGEDNRLYASKVVSIVRS